MVRKCPSLVLSHQCPDQSNASLARLSMDFMQTTSVAYQNNWMECLHFRFDFFFFLLLFQAAMVTEKETQLKTHRKWFLSRISLTIPLPSLLLATLFCWSAVYTLFGWGMVQAFFLLFFRKVYIFVVVALRKVHTWFSFRKFYSLFCLRMACTFYSLIMPLLHSI